MVILKRLGMVFLVLAFIVVSGCSGMAVKSNTMANNKGSTHEYLAFDDNDENYDNWD